ncbi:MAG: hypothetical protein EB012_01685 [Gammaproteobacteria bacterium]|nr:hypothetical protein [Gammaproteobacteria bacterium]
MKLQPDHCETLVISLFEKMGAGPGVHRKKMASFPEAQRVLFKSTVKRHLLSMKTSSGDGDCWVAEGLRGSVHCDPSSAG